MHEPGPVRPAPWMTEAFGYRLPALCAARGRKEAGKGGLEPSAHVSDFFRALTPFYFILLVWPVPKSYHTSSSPHSFINMSLLLASLVSDPDE